MSDIAKKITYGELGNKEYQALFKFTNGETVLGIINYDNGDVYMGEIKPDEKYDGKRDRRRHGYGKVFPKRGKVVDGEWHLGQVIGKSVTFDKKGKRTVEVRGSDPSFRTILYSYYLTDDNKYGGDNYNGLYKDKFWDGDFKDVFRRGELREQLFNGTSASTTAASSAQKSAPTKEKAPTKNNAVPKEPAVKAKIERIEYASGNVYEGEMKDGLRNGVGTFRWSDGDVYIGEYVNDVRQGKGKFLYASGNVYEGDFFNGNFHGYGVFRWADGDVYDGEWKNDERHGNGKYTYADGSYYTGVWENNTKISSSEIIYPDKTEDFIEEVYEQSVDTADNGFETMTDYYTACLDEDSTLFDDGFGHLHSAVKHIEPYFQAVIENLEDRDPATAQELLAEIVQVDLLALNEATANDGIFSSEELQLYDLCECALKCAYNECIANQSELTETAMLHFAYYLYNEYSTLNERSPSNFFMYYLDYYVQTYGIEQNVMWDIGALYFARIFVNDQPYSAIPEGEVYYEFEEIYGEFLDGLFEDENMDIFANVQGRLYDSDFGYIDAQFDEEIEEEEDGPQAFTTENGNAYYGYVNEDGKCHGWGEMQYADGDVYVGHWRNGFRHGFGMELWSDGTLRVGEFVNGELNGIGFERAGSASVNNANGYYRLIEATYFKNDEKAPNPAFCYEYMGREHGFGAYSDVYRYYGQLDECGDADGWCCLWNPKGEPQYYSEGMYLYGDIDFGMRLWLYKDGRTSWCYGDYKYSADENGYIMYADIRGYYGEVAIDKGKPCLYYYDTGVFANDALHGDGTRYYSNGVIIDGRFKDGYLMEIYSITKPNGEKGSPEDYEDYIGYSDLDYWRFF